MDAQVALEQARVDAYYALLDERAARRLAAAEENRRPLDRDASPQEVFERDAAEHLFVQSQAEWESLDDFLVIGRLDLADGTTHHIGKAAADLGDGDALLDWRAPAAALFFTASAADPGPVVRRRAITVVRRRVRAVRDEVFVPSAVDWSTVVECETEDLLRAVVDSGSPRLAGVLSTMSQEQHEALHVQAQILLLLGGPGTGKTAVAQHRISLMAFQRRSRRLRSRILVVSPTRRLGSYAETLLPLLGEHDVTTAVLEDPTARMPGRESVMRLDDPHQVASAVGRAQQELRPRITEPLRVVLKGEVVTLRPGHLAHLRGEVLHTSRSEKEANHLYRAWVAEHVTRSWWRTRRSMGEWVAADERRDTFRTAYADERLKAFTAWACPVVTLDMVMDELCRPTDQPAVGRPWAIGVTGLRAEVEHVLDRNQTRDDFDHDIVLVDEAQELSPLHWRSLAAANPRAQWVVAGDWQQTDRRHQADSVRALTRALRAQREAVVVRTLTVNFRSSREVGERAALICRRHAPSRTPLPGVWSAGTEGVWHRQAADPAALARLLPQGREIGVVVPVSLRQPCIDALGPEATVVTALEAKGLEFDQLVLAWPELIAEEGASQVLVAATRASRMLHVVSGLAAAD